MSDLFDILKSTWTCISSFEIYCIKIIPLIFSVCGIIVFIRILINFLGGD